MCFTPQPDVAFFMAQTNDNIKQPPSFLTASSFLSVATLVFLDIMAPKTDAQRLTREVQYLYQPLRLILFQFSCLTPIFTRLAATNQLKDFVKEAVPALLGIFRQADNG